MSSGIGGQRHYGAVGETASVGCDINARRTGGKESTTMTSTSRSLRTIVALVGTYLGISVLTLAAIILLRNDPSIVNAAVWIRGTIVVASAALMLSFAVRALHGSERSHLRVRIISAVMFVAIVVIICLPGTFPLWMKIEQAVCGALLLAVVIIANGKALRTKSSKSAAAA
jgi:hypothetical protein